MAIAAVIAAMLVIIPFTSAHAAGTLLSQGQPTTASSIEGASTAANFATDGSTTTRWGSVFADPQWLEVDLGATDTVTQVVLNWEAAYATAYQIQTSTDNVNWTSIYSTTTSTGGVQTLNITGSGRYVRMYGTVRVGGYGYSLWEFQVYGNTGTPPSSPPPSTTPPTGCGTTNVALNKTATASSTENAGTEMASAAVDGSTTTRWSSLGTDPQWLEVDLGSSQSICAVTLNWETAYGKAFQIQTSTDNANWTSIYTTTTGTGGVQNLTGLSGTGRYIRMYGTVRGTQYGYSLWEFSVFVGGSPTSPPPSSPPPSSPPPSSPPPGNWTTVFSDDFTGTANTGVNAGNWKYDTGTAYAGGPANWGTGEVETMTNSTSNVALDGNGHLKITAVNSGGAWTSGRIETQRSDFAAPAGGQLRISAVIQQPNPANAIGYAPAFVAMGAGYRTDLTTWPGSGEMDIMQDVNGKSQVSANLQCGTAPDGPCTEYNGRNSALLTCQTCQTAYHTYSEIIDRSTTDESIKFFLDNDQIWVVRESDVGQAAWTAAVDHGFFLMLNLGVGTAFANAVCGCTSPTAATSSGGALLVDSVTVQTQNIGVPAGYTTPATPTGGTVVKVTGTTKGNWGLTLNGAPYTIKGMTYGPPAAAAAGYMATLKKMGVNTIRTWGTDGTTQPLLDNAAAWGIHVINGFWLNQGADYVNDTAYKTSTLNTIVATVNQYKNNPGVLMWDVGNEVILTTQDHYTGAQIEAERIAYAQYVNQVVDAIHAADPNHPVTSTDAYTGAWPYYKQYTPDLDLLAVNSYGAGCSVPGAFASGGYTKPYILTEGGASGEWEVPNDANGVPTEPTDQQKRDAYPTEWNCLTADHGDFLGGTFFHFGTENDFGGVWLNTYGGAWKRLSYYSVAGMYGGNPGTNTPPVITSMTAGQNVPAGGTFPVSVAVSDPNGDPIHYNLMYSNKYVSGGGTGFSWASFTQTGNGTFTVTAPASMGIWKVYVYAYDGQGNVGIETRSFNVVAPPVSGTNVSKGKTTTASTFQAADSQTYTPGNATDGNFGTRWASAWADPQWIQVDLGAVTAIHHVQLAWESAYGKAYQIQTSNDGTNWTTVYSTTTGDGGFDDIDLNVSGRYVRMNGTARATTYGYSLFEFGVYS